MIILKHFEKVKAIDREILSRQKIKIITLS